MTDEEIQQEYIKLSKERYSLDMCYRLESSKIWEKINILRENCKHLKTILNLSPPYPFNILPGKYDDADVCIICGKEIEKE